MNDILEKIKKLLRLSRSANQHEAELAMQRALELAARHRIDISKLDPDDTQSTINHATSRSWKRFPIEAKLAAVIIKNFFHVDVVLSCPSDYEQVAFFIGTPSEIAIADYVFGFLVGHFQRSWTQRKNRRLKNRKNFIHGMFYGISKKLSEAKVDQAAKSSASALSISCAHYIKTHLGQTDSKAFKPNSDQNSSSFLHGYMVGSQTTINPAIRA